MGSEMCIRDRTVAVVQSSSDNSAIRYVLPVLWMTSYFPVMGRHIANMAYTHSESPGGSTGAKSDVDYCLVMGCIKHLRLK